LLSYTEFVSKSFILLFLACGLADAQTGLELAEQGRCQPALPLLRRTINLPTTTKDLKRRLGFAGVRCAMTLNSSEDATRFLDVLNREFPHDPEILFLAVHLYSDLSIRASQELLYTNPGSPQVHQLNAESLEAQGDWKHALEEYRVVLERQPNMRGIHYQIGRLILSQPKTPTTFADASKEMQAELRIDPYNAGAEYVLGEIARQEDRWPEAIDHFSKASRLDAGFADAFVGLGRSLMAVDRVAEAVAPLQTAARIEPQNPTTHYYAAIALRRTGRKVEGDQEYALFQQTTAKAQKTKDDVQQGVMGPQRVEMGKPGQ
jgi:tetratricopeptide (TPR) repeat protein